MLLTSDLQTVNGIDQSVAIMSWERRAGGVSGGSPVGPVADGASPGTVRRHMSVVRSPLLWSGASMLSCDSLSF